MVCWNCDADIVLVFKSGTLGLMCESGIGEGLFRVRADKLGVL